jgi:hypothetical protein
MPFRPWGKWITRIAPPLHEQEKRYPAKRRVFVGWLLVEFTSTLSRYFGAELAEGSEAAIRVAFTDKSLSFMTSSVLSQSL